MCPLSLYEVSTKSLDQFWSYALNNSVKDKHTDGKTGGDHYHIPLHLWGLVGVPGARPFFIYCTKTMQVLFFLRVGGWGGGGGGEGGGGGVGGVFSLLWKTETDDTVQVFKEKL